MRSQTLKQSVKQLILHGVEFAGFNRLARHYTRRRLLALCYHGVLSAECLPNDARLNLAVTAAQFDQQMQELRRNWNPVTIEQVRQSIEEGVPLPDKAVLVTFDDGFRNNLTVAQPILEKYQIPAIVFITTDMIGTDNLIWAVELIERLVSWKQMRFTLGATQYVLPPPDTPERTWAVSSIMDSIRNVSQQESQAFVEHVKNQTTLDLSPAWKRELYEFMNWDEVRQIQQKGFAIGAHTASHPILSHLEPEELEAEMSGSSMLIEQELEKSSAKIEGEKFDESKERAEKETKTKIDTIAYPFGSQYDYSDEVVSKARDLGFRLGFTLTERRNPKVLDPMRISRICICNDLTLASFRALISGIRGN